MLKFKTSCAVLAYLSSNLLNEVGLSLFRYFEVGLRVCDIVVNKFTFAISSPDEFLLSNSGQCSNDSLYFASFRGVARLKNMGWTIRRVKWADGCEILLGGGFPFSTKDGVWQDGLYAILASQRTAALESM